MLRGQGSYDCVILVLRERIWNVHVPAASLLFPAFDNTGSLGFPLIYSPRSMVPPWVTASRFLAGNKEAELKPTTFSLFTSTFPYFSVFPLLILQRCSTSESCLLGLLLNNISNLVPPRWWVMFWATPLPTTRAAPLTQWL